MNPTSPDPIRRRGFPFNQGLRACVFALPLIVGATAFAQSAGEPLGEARPDRKERLEALREQTRTLRSSAEAAYKSEVAECQKRILVNDCIAKAKQRRLERIQEARKLEIEESAIERELKRDELAERRARKARSMASRPPPEITTSPPESVTDEQPAAGSR